MQRITPVESDKNHTEESIGIVGCQSVGWIVLCVVPRCSGRRWSRKKVAFELELETLVAVRQ